MSFMGITLGAPLPARAALRDCPAPGVVDSAAGKPCIAGRNESGRNFVILRSTPFEEVSDGTAKVYLFEQVVSSVVVLPRADTFERTQKMLLDLYGKPTSTTRFTMQDGQEKVPVRMLEWEGKTTTILYAERYGRPDLGHLEFQDEVVKKRHRDRFQPR